MRSTSLSKLLSFTCLAAPAVLFGAAHAQTPAAPPQPAPAAEVAEEAEGEETVIVTGSSIRRKPQESASPLQIFQVNDLKRESVNSPEQFVSLLTSNGTGLDNLASNADVVAGQARGNNGASSANLRSQGASATLVLLNGRRVAAHGLNGGAVDVNQIPLAAIERVEVLKDGASAVYGTDAIGGVINFITRRDFQGVTVQGFADVPQEEGGDIYRATITAGYGDLDEDRFNVMASLTYSEHQELRGDQRGFVNTFQPNRGLSVDTRGTPFATIFPLNTNATWAPTGTLFGPSTGASTAPFLPGSTTVRASGGVNPLDLPGGLGCASIDGMAAYDEVLWDNATATLACAWDTGRAAVLQQPISTYTLFARGIAAFGQHEVSLEVTGSKAESAKKFSNPQFSANTTTTPFLFPRNATSAAVYDRVFNQLNAAFAGALTPRFGLPMAFRWRCIECGRREIFTETETGRVFLGAEGPLAWDWDYRVGASYAYSESKSTLGRGYYYRDTGLGVTGLVNVLNSGAVNIFLQPGETQSAAGLAALESASARGVVLYGGKFEVTQIDGSISGPIWELPGGTAFAAVGFDLRREDYAFNGDERAAASRPVILLAPFDEGNILAGVTRDIRAFYAEVALPLFEGFELTLAGRYDDYTGFGSTTNPRVTFRYRPLPEIMFRGSYNTGFRVPSFNQIFNRPSESPFTGITFADPRTCPTITPNAAVPGCQSVTFTVINGGKIDLGPEESEQVGLGIVFEPSPDFSLSVDYWRIERTNTIQLLTLQQIFQNNNLFPERFIRDASGTLLAVDQRWVNAGASITEGVDISARGAFEGLNGQFSVGMDATIMLDIRSRLTANSPFGPSEVGVFTFGGDLGLRWKHNLWVTYENGPWTASLSQIFRAGYLNQALPGVANGRINPPDVERVVEDYVIYNASIGYDVTEDATVTLGVKNLFDTDPPFAINYDSSLGSGSSWEPRVADPRGRSFTLLLEYRY